MGGVKEKNKEKEKMMFATDLDKLEVKPHHHHRAAGEQARRASASPKHWGGALWFILHNASIYYRSTELSVAEMVDFIRGMPAIIPCGTCKKHVRRMITSIGDKELWAIASNRWRTFQFFVDMHNKVNRRLGAATVSPIQAYTNLTGKQTKCLQPSRLHESAIY